MSAAFVQFVKENRNIICNVCNCNCNAEEALQRQREIQYDARVWRTIQRN